MLNVIYIKNTTEIRVTYKIVLSILEIVFLFFGFKKCNSTKYSYRESNTVDYKVFLKENNYFDTPYLEKDNTYITSLIDYIDSSFNYNIYFNKSVTGTLNYKLIAQIKANKTNEETGSYWTKEFDLTEMLADNLENSKSHSIKLEQQIDYNKYNDLLNNFVKDYALQTDSILKIALVVTGDVNVNNTNENFNVNSEVSLDVPLSKLAVEGKINTSNNNIEKEIVEQANKLDMLHTIFRILLVLNTIILVYYIYRYIKCVKNQSTYLGYDSKIKKINNEYDGIITKVKSAKLDYFTIIEVEDFESLISVYENIKEPINFLEGAEESKYFIINNNSCYIYNLSKKDYK